jgi:hypothetical protein
MAEMVSQPADILSIVVIDVVIPLGTVPLRFAEALAPSLAIHGFLALGTAHDCQRVCAVSRGARRTDVLVFVFDDDVD